MITRTALLLTALLVSAPSSFTLEKDDREDYFHIKNNLLYQGDSPEAFNAILLKDVCRAGMTDGEVVKAFIRVSEVGATALGFDLQGFNADGTSINQENLLTFQKLKDDADYRWTKLVCRVLGNFPNSDHKARLNAVRTAAKALRHSGSVLYWIEGPRSAKLVKAFKAIAPRLTVAAPHGGDLDAILYEHSIKSSRPALVIGHVPARTSAHVLSIVEGTPENLKAYDAMNALPLESLDWTPSTDGLSQEEIDDGFYSLFHQSDMSNWTVTGRKNGFIENHGGISWNGRGGDHVTSRKRYDNFILRLEWKLHRYGGNSGVFIRAPRENRESSMGMEIQIFGDPGEEPSENSTGAIYDVLPATSNPSNPIGFWNQYEIMADGPHIRVTLNGVVVQEVNVDDDEVLIHRMRRGFIKLQDHGDPVTFHHIRIKEL